MRWGVVGYGSIGRKHVNNILSLGDEAIVCTKASDCPVKHVATLEELLNSSCDRIILANETSLHFQSYKTIRSINSSIPVLIEKPVFEKHYDVADSDKHAYVAYCLRSHPLIHSLKKRLVGKKILSAQFYVGQYLPDWRPGRDYRTTYSAKKEMGGGVTRDLSHELDLAHYLLGEIRLKYSSMDKVSDLEITSEDSYVGIFTSPTCPLITVQMNYLDKITQRYLTIITSEETYRVDFIAKTLQTNTTTEHFDFSPNEMYLNMLNEFKSQQPSCLSTLNDGLFILKLIEQSEKNLCKN